MEGIRLACITHDDRRLDDADFFDRCCNLSVFDRILDVIAHDTKRQNLADGQPYRRSLEPEFQVLLHAYSLVISAILLASPAGTVLSCSSSWIAKKVSSSMRLRRASVLSDNRASVHLPLRTKLRFR